MSDALRCDICTELDSVSPIRWTYRTADSLSAEQRARILDETKPLPDRGIEWRPVEDGETPGYAFADPEWAVCQPCHELIQDGDLAGIVERNMQKQWAGMVLIGPEEGREKIGRLVREAQEESARILFAFWTHRDGDPVPV